MKGQDHILSVAIPRPLDGLFTYRLPERLLPLVHVGGWVKVPFGKKTTHAFIVEPPKGIDQIPEGLSADSLKEILEVSDQGSIFTPDVLELCRWTQEYYCAPLGEVLHCAAPAAALGLKNARTEPRALTAPAILNRAIELTEDQKQALDVLIGVEDAERPSPSKSPLKSKVALLHGVTGSGKTELYLEMAKRAIARGRGVIILVPEIALSSQLHRRFEEGLGTSVALWHSAVADGKRRDLSAALRSGDVRVVVGARSAVFAPVRDLGLIVVDEEHDPTYKQEDRVRYNARDLAVVRARICGALAVLGSATPSLETRERVAEGKYAIAHLPSRVGAAKMPEIDLVDLSQEPKVEGIQAPFAARTIEAIQNTIRAGEQVMIFLNRRGFASFLLCQDCGQVNECPNCSVSLTIHKKRAKLRCHVCGHEETPPDVCSKCQGTNFLPMGAGTESLEEELPRLIPEMIPQRLDRDQITSATRLEQILADFRSGKSNTLLGTQMLVKGHDFPNVTLVVVVLADGLFRWPDFRAPERGYQILKQVSGRAGRGDKPGRVMIQTFAPEHPVVSVINGKRSEAEFLETEREIRKLVGYPPFGRLARLRIESTTRDEAMKRSTAIAERLAAVKTDEKCEVLGPSEALLERAKGIYRWDLLIKGARVQDIQKRVRAARDAARAEKWPLIVDIDPNGT